MMYTSPTNVLPLDEITGVSKIPHLSFYAKNDTAIVFIEAECIISSCVTASIDSHNILVGLPPNMYETD